MALITNATLGLVRDEIQRRNGKLRDIAETLAKSTWDRVRLDVVELSREALIAKYPIGTELICKYTLNGAAYDFPWVVLDNDRECEHEDRSTHPGLWLGAKYATIEDIMFDKPEGIVTDDATAEDGFYYCGVTGDTYTMLDLNAGDTVPHGSYDRILKGTINHRDVYHYGYNRYRDSAFRQWLNSDAGAGEWWAATHYGDNAPDQLASRAGFMAGLDSDFLEVIQPVKIQVAANTTTDGGVTDVMYDRFFLQSLEEVYGVPQAAGTEGAYFPYWKQVTGLENPTNGSGTDTNPARQIRKINNPTGSAADVRLRSACRGSSGGAWVVYAAGYLYYGGAYGSCAALPACVIS